MKTNLINGNGVHAISPEDYPKWQETSFINFLLESEKHNYYPNQTFKCIHPVKSHKEFLFRWFPDVQHGGSFNLCWTSEGVSDEWFAVPIDSFFLTTQVQTA